MIVNKSTLRKTIKLLFPLPVKNTFLSLQLFNFNVLNLKSFSVILKEIMTCTIQLSSNDIILPISYLTRGHILDIQLFQIFRKKILSSL